MSTPESRLPRFDKGTRFAYPSGARPLQRGLPPVSSKLNLPASLRMRLTPEFEKFLDQSHRRIYPPKSVIINAGDVSNEHQRSGNFLNCAIFFNHSFNIFIS